MGKKVIVIGAGPAGLTAALELLRIGNHRVVILESTRAIGGISQTADYKGNRIDIGGHRFFSKSDRVMKWWTDRFPIQGKPSYDDRLLGRDIPLSTEPGAPDPEETDRVMLIRRRVSRIYFLRKFFDYPISLSKDTMKKLGLLKMVRIGVSYILARLLPRPEKSLEDFFINRFGRELYQTFFMNYTEKVWGIPCSQIEPDWGAQRVKGLTVSKLILHFLKQRLFRRSTIAQKKTETSLIEQFLYPKLGPGSLWEAVADDIREAGGEILMGCRVTGLFLENGRVSRVRYMDDNGAEDEVNADAVVSTMPVKDLIAACLPRVPEKVETVARGLIYRDFITCGILVGKLRVTNTTPSPTLNNIVPDNWIYIQEPNVRIGRLQIFNNWSPYLPKNPDTVWIGTEYFCFEGDSLWNLSDNDLAALAIDECARIGVIDPAEVMDSCVIRVPRAYPAYFGSYRDFGVIRTFLDSIGNLYPVGRNGMHRYNNMDHSMLTAMIAAELISNGITDKSAIWAVNAEDDYHEGK